MRSAVYRLLGLEADDVLGRDQVLLRLRHLRLRLGDAAGGAEAVEQRHLERDGGVPTCEVVAEDVFGLADGMAVVGGEVEARPSLALLDVHDLPLDLDGEGGDLQVGPVGNRGGGHRLRVHVHRAPVQHVGGGDGRVHRLHHGRVQRAAGVVGLAAGLLQLRARVGEVHLGAQHVELGHHPRLAAGLRHLEVLLLLVDGLLGDADLLQREHVRVIGLDGRERDLVLRAAHVLAPEIEAEARGPHRGAELEAPQRLADLEAGIDDGGRLGPKRVAELLREGVEARAVDERGIPIPLSHRDQVHGRQGVREGFLLPALEGLHPGLALADLGVPGQRAGHRFRAREGHGSVRVGRGSGGTSGHGLREREEQRERHRRPPGVHPSRTASTSASASSSDRTRLADDQEPAHRLRQRAHVDEHPHAGVAGSQLSGADAVLHGRGDARHQVLVEGRDGDVRRRARRVVDEAEDEAHQLGLRPRTLEVDTGHGAQPLAEGAGSGQQPLDLGREGREHALDEGAVDALLAAVEVVQGRLGDAGRLADLADGRGVVALRREQLQRAQ